ncbi:sensor histidine kinase [Haliovirga abyssi]|uniref:histidine kinase n=1 Tax=Haliovirga abyssi TaxID=2996794 RepID=A0AAU9DJ27_9FUSO|nr:HAMP domain-containing sensor histidine kinase [Haliovirga abyssi]BDU49842.1 hypothetical protein HLVA_04110 [Haliovirga abyssi]
MEKSERVMKKFNLGFEKNLLEENLKKMSIFSKAFIILGFVLLISHILVNNINSFVFPKLSYTITYGIIIVYSIGWTVFLNNYKIKNIKIAKIINLIFEVGMLTLGAIIALISVNISKEVSAYIIAIFTIASLMYMKFYESIFVFSVGHSIFIIGLLFLQIKTETLIGFYTSTTVAVLLGILIARINFTKKVREFLSNTIIKEKNRELKIVREKIIATENLQTISQIMGKIAHELNSPLAGELYTLKMIKDDLKEKFSENLEIVSILEDLNELEDSLILTKEIVSKLLKYSSQDTHFEENVDIKEVIEYSFKNLEKKYNYDNFKLDKIFKEDFIIFANKVDIVQLIENILENSFESLKNKDVKKISISTYKKDNKKIIEIEDNGMGINEKIIQKIYVPFFTTKYKEKNLGLGLTIGKEILKKYNGEMEIESKKDIYTKVKIIFKDE